MDHERLGRVLGAGTRYAAKTLVGVVEAASAPSPHAEDVAAASTSAQMPARRAGAVGRAPSTVTVPQGPKDTEQTAGRSGNRRGLAEGGRRFGRAVWEPTARLSGVLWLEITGLFFGIFVVVAATAAWRLRGAAHLLPGASNAQAHTELVMSIAMLLLFGYFAVSSFLAANRRSRRR